MQLRHRVVDLFTPLSNPCYRRIWAAQLLSELADYAARLALSMLVYDRTQSASLATATLALSLLPWVGPGQLLATLGDRFGRRVVMVASDLVRAAVFASLCFSMPLGALLTLTFLAGLATPPFEAARSAALPELVPGPGLGQAYRLSGITQDLAMVLGSLVGGLLLALGGPVAALLVNAASFAVSAMLLRGLPALRVSDHGPGSGRLGSSGRLRAAVALLWRTRLLRRATLLANLAVGAGTAVETLVVPHVATEFAESSWLAGAVWATTSAACILVTAATPVHGSTGHLMRVTALLALLPAGLAGVVLLVPSAGVGTLGFVVAGGLFAALVPAQTIIAPRLPPVLRATAFSVLMGVMSLMQAAMILLGGALADTMSARLAAAVICAFPVAGAIWVLLTPATDDDVVATSAPEAEAATSAEVEIRHAGSVA